MNAHTYRGPRPPVRTTAQWETRSRSLIRDPAMHRLVYGHWVNADVPLDTLQRAVLLQRQLTTSRSVVRITGITALKLLGLPIGPSHPWVNRLLRHPVPPKGRELHGYLSGRIHLSWQGARRRCAEPDVTLSTSYGLPSIDGPWGSTVVDPVEALVVAAPMLSRWAIVACLDALLTASPTMNVQDRLDRLPPTSRAVVAVRRALEHVQLPTLSPMETLLRMIVTGHGLPRPVMNHRVDTPHGYSLLDLAWPESKTALEYNGRVHSQDHTAYKDEMYRNEVLRDLEWNLRILVFEDLSQPIRRERWLSWLGERLGVRPRDILGRG